MRERQFTIPELALIGGTRVALGIGIGLLLAGRLDSGQRRAAGISLVLVGGLSTIPLAIGIAKKSGSQTLEGDLKAVA